MQPEEIQFTPAELGLDGPAYVYDYFSGTGKLLGSDKIFSSPLDKKTSAFYVVAPVGKSGIAFLGDKNKFVGTGKQRITSLDDQADKLTVGVTLAANEPDVILHGFATKEPEAIVVAGQDDAVQYNPATHYFTVSNQCRHQRSRWTSSAADPVSASDNVIPPAAEMIKKI